ncbi:hypothetical protein EVAR_55833_1 [Eumeta japonica]|uniref:Uncharacterized protein n=1 Tax=Eumeta variegata TaxID=151549 RepID=A0A4C1YZ75_EUMVA|nr:hypothetical protein EVAR_55833_1 [Eumeta japonica]
MPCRDGHAHASDSHQPPANSARSGRDARMNVDTLFISIARRNRAAYTARNTRPAILALCETENEIEISLDRHQRWNKSGTAITFKNESNCHPEQDQDRFKNSLAIGVLLCDGAICKMREFILRHAGAVTDKS